MELDDSFFFRGSGGKGPRWSDGAPRGRCGVKAAVEDLCPTSKISVFLLVPERGLDGHPFVPT